ncbi:LAMI_0G11144g1_1 [Lachancea mirantina]|uniref:D-lactate dehydrogenase (cytochrome) n=1 Tax=Lachancea mirantina TaxID=1230905 RepID=A0A1G4KAY1_9SACH|nr:LAMI_0G11144g1_1 [Lachancea mirantina]
MLLQRIGRGSAVRVAKQQVFANKGGLRYQSSGNRPFLTKNKIVNISSLFIGLGLGIYAKIRWSSHDELQVFPEPSTTPLNSVGPPKYGSDADLQKCVVELRELLGKEYVRDSEAEIEHHTDNGFNPSKPQPEHKPRIIIYPGSTEQVSDAMKIISRYNIPIVPFSGGTSLEGHTYSTRQGIVMNTSRMNQIVKVNIDDLDAVLQAGVGWQQLNEHLSELEGAENLMLGCDCGPGAHVCGMVSTNASGIGATRYGSMVSNIISVTAVLADGTVIKTKRRPRKSSAGYNLTGLLAGSEGTLAIITEVTVKLQVRPAHETVVLVQFPTLKDSTNAVASLFKSGIQLNAVEFLDAGMMQCINYSDLTSKKFENYPTLLFKIAGLNKIVVTEYVKEVKKVCQNSNCRMFEFARDEVEAEELFSVRKNALYVMLDYGYNEISEDAKMWVTDFAVPLSRLASTLEQADKLMEAYPLKHLTLGHVGDGNFHLDIFYLPEQYEMCKRVVDKLAVLALENEGTCSGEHGIGFGKRAMLEDELGEATISAMRKLKMALDPKRLLNPDKVFKIDPLDSSKD